MKTQITVARLALIGAIVTAIAGIMVPLITHFTPSSPGKTSAQPAATTIQNINGDRNKVSGRDFYDNSRPAKKAVEKQ